MYEAKDLSAGVVAYRQDRDTRTPSRLALLGELRRALDADELLVHYQPQVDMTTGLLCGLEALVRWQHPDRGLLAPAAFLPVAETTGLISRLTLRVLDLALAQTRLWHDQQRAVPVAVNLSARCLHDPQLPDIVRTALARHGVPARLLRLEITESAIMGDPERALSILRRLSDDGVRLSLDDFGTGYSSMSYLRELPVDELKVDRSFVTDMTGDAKDHLLVRTAVELGHNLGLSVVAEGVEDEPTLTALTGLGCDVAQGYLLARPMDAAALVAWRDARDRP
jgi:EAL domain-containing protein (putative c-di-GMP-specific phosphodiesterase class I)